MSSNYRLRNGFELFKRQRRVLMLMHHLGRGAPEQPMACHHLPERHTQRVKVRTDVYVDSC